MALALDHLVVAALSLDEGAAWVEARLGARPEGGGRHPAMGTHNRLLGLGPVYLEVIAVDPSADAPARPRWFELDRPAMRERLRRGPALIHWVASTDDIERDAARAAAPPGEIVRASRGDYRWRITVPPDGGLPEGGVSPTLIQWDGASPAAALPDSGCRLESLELRHPRARAIEAALRAMELSPPEGIRAIGGGPALAARIRAPRGPADLV
jgi:hypothetical protein